MDLKNKNIKIPYFIVEQIINILDKEKETNENIDNLYLYLLGKKIQFELRENFNKDETVRIQYNKNKKIIDELTNKLLKEK